MAKHNSNNIRSTAICVECFKRFILRWDDDHSDDDDDDEYNREFRHFRMDIKIDFSSIVQEMIK